MIFRDLQPGNVFSFLDKRYVNGKFRRIDDRFLNRVQLRMYKPIALIVPLNKDNPIKTISGVIWHDNLETKVRLYKNANELQSETSDCSP